MDYPSHFFVENFDKNKEICALSWETLYNEEDSRTDK